MVSATVPRKLRAQELILQMAKRAFDMFGHKPKENPWGEVQGADTGNSGKSENEGSENKVVIPSPPPPHAEGEYREDRRATSAGPQLFTLLVDHSYSMNGKKAEEATRVLRKIIEHACDVNTSFDSTGEKTYFYTQVLLFAETYEDSTGGMKRPRNESTPVQAFSVRQSGDKKVNDRLGDLTNYQKPLAHVYKTLTGREGMNKKRKAAAMPAPIVLFITDGIPNLPKGKAVELAKKEANKIKTLTLPEVENKHPIHEKIVYPAEQVRLITIGLGDEQDFNPDLLTELCTHVEYKGEDLPLYLHCPREEDLKTIGAQIVGTITRADQTGQTLDEVIYNLRRSLGKKS